MLVTVLVSETVDGPLVAAACCIAIGAMLVVSFVVIGVAPRTLGRQHSETVALLLAPGRCGRSPGARSAARSC